MIRRWAWWGASLVLAGLVTGLAGGRGHTGAPRPVINEVAWGGTAASTSDEWVTSSAH